MALSKVTINKGQGGLGRAPLNNDHISGMIFYNAVLPSGFGASDRIKIVNSIEEAEALGIIEGSGDHAFMWYQINEHFRLNNNTRIYIGIFAVPGGAYDFTELETLVLFAEGEIRQAAVMVEAKVLADADITTLNGIAAGLENNEEYPVQVLYAADTSGVADYTTLTDLHTLANSRVSVVVGEDGGAEGAALAVTLTHSVPAVGACLGAISAAAVHESIAWRASFNLVSGAELDTPALGNGDLIKDKATSFLNGLDDKGYIFLVKERGIAGTYFNFGYTAVALTNDYATIELNRAIDKAVRGVRAALKPQLNSPLLVAADGTLSEDSIGYFKGIAENPLALMVNAGELSGQNIIIDPAQNVLSTSTLVITAQLQPVGVAKFIDVNIGFVTTLTT